MTDTPRTPNPYETAETYGDYINQLRAELAAALERAEKAEAEREALRKDADNMEMTCRKAFYKLSRGMAVTQETLAGLKKYGERSVSTLRDDAAIGAARGK